MVIKHITCPHQFMMTVLIVLVAVARWDVISPPYANLLPASALTLLERRWQWRPQMAIVTAGHCNHCNYRSPKSPKSRLHGVAMATTSRTAFNFKVSAFSTTITLSSLWINSCYKRVPAEANTSIQTQIMKNILFCYEWHPGKGRSVFKLGLDSGLFMLMLF